jgi:hypothetical protein
VSADRAAGGLGVPKTALEREAPPQEALTFADPADEKLFQEVRAHLIPRERPERPRNLRLVWRSLFSRHRKAGPVLMRALRSHKLLWLVLTLSVSVLVLAGVFAPLDLALFVGVLLFHELGHYLGMVIFGYRDVHMFFIPFFGAAVSGKKVNAPAWQEAIVLLLGPIPGLVLGCGCYFLDATQPSVVVHHAARWLVYLNFLNLFPFEPLDGGRFFNIVLLSRHRLLESGARVAMGVGVVVLCWPTAACMAIAGGLFLLLMAFSGLKTGKVAETLRQRWPAWPSQIAELSEAQVRDLFQEVRRSYTLGAKTQPTLYATLMRPIHERTAAQPASLGVALPLLAVYAAAVLLSLATYLYTGLQSDAGNWPFGMIQQSLQ